MRANWHHVGISVRDMQRALRFYRDLLGFEVEWEHQDRGGPEMARVVGLADVRAHMAMLKGYGGRIELFLYDNPKGREAGPRRQCDFGLIHFGLTVQDIWALYEQLLAAGVEFNCPPQVLRPGVTATYMKDPEGNTIELVEYQEGA
jgi:catechol 2,3-dioxygenase-like lactoylglutathione lyase family enzyme